MKIVFVSFLSVLCTLVSVQAQVTFPKGMQSLNGSVSYYRSSGESSNSNRSYPTSNSSALAQASTAIDWGHFIKDNLSLTIGLGGTYSMNDNSNTYPNYPSLNSVYYNSNKNTSVEAQISVGLTQYYPIGNSNFAFAIVTAIGGGMGRDYADQSGTFMTNTETTRNVFSGSAYAAPQLLYLITPKWSVNGRFGSIAYRYSKTFSLGNDDYETTNTQLTSSLGLNSLSLGLTYFIR